MACMVLILILILILILVGVGLGISEQRAARQMVETELMPVR